MPLRLYALTPERTPLTLPDMTSLDAITRQLPPGLYSTFRTFDNRQRVIGLRQHLKRLYVPARQMGIQPRADESSLRRALAASLADLGTGEARVRLILTLSGDLYFALEPFAPLPEEVYEQGVRVITFPLHREKPALKSTAFIEISQQARRQAAEAGAFEALMVWRGRILEGVTSNFFYVQGGVLGTAGRGVLPGVTRRLVLRLARRGGGEVRYAALPLAEIPRLEEAFLTSSSRGIVPIVQIDDVPVGEGRVGAWTKRLALAYAAYVEERSERLVG
jgi:branched-chain amino acid aminotransferase